MVSVAFNKARNEMANDRIRIACKTCGESICLYKFYPGGGYSKDNEGLGEILNEFFNEHVESCHPYRDAMYLYGEPGFFLYTESNEGDAKIKILSALQKAREG